MKKILILVAGLALLGAGCEEPTCLRAHIETRHQPERHRATTLTGMPWVGKGALIMRTDPAYDYNVTVCDEYAPIENK